MDRLGFLEIEMDKLREKLTSVDELRQRLNNLESWITANVGLGMNSKSIYRGLILPQPPTPVESEAKTQLPSCLIINRLSTTSSGTSVDPSSLFGHNRFHVDKSQSLPANKPSASTFPEAEISSTEVIPAPLASAEQIVQESSSSLPFVSSSNAEVESAGTEKGGESEKNKRDFRCSKCTAHFSNVITYRKHKVKHNKAYDCRLCPKKFVESWHLLQHIQDVHPNSNLPALRNKTPINGQKKGRNEKGGHAPQVQFQVRAVARAPNHLNRRHSTGSSGLKFQNMQAPHLMYSSPQNDRNKSNSVSISSRTPVASGSTNFQRSYACGLCGKSFTSAQNLREHVTNHPSPALIATGPSQPSHQ